MIFILGDVHGMWEIAEHLIEGMVKREGEPSEIIQLGDLGVGFPNWPPWRYPFSYPFYALAGNHDNHELLKVTNRPFMNAIEFMPTGTIKQVGAYRALVVRGAASVDSHMRTEGVDWWSGELLTYTEAQSAIDSAETAGGVSLILSHERPSCFHSSLFDGKDGHYPSEGQRNLLKGIHRCLKPKLWFFGHYHEAREGFDEETRWFCVPDVRHMTALVVDGADVRWVNARSF